MESIDLVTKRLTAGENPMKLKLELAHQLVRELHDPQSADNARKEFETRFQKGNLTQSNLPIIPIRALASLTSVSTILVDTGIADSRSKAKQLIEQHAVKMNDILITSETLSSKIKAGDILKAGKKAVKIV